MRRSFICLAVVVIAATASGCASPDGKVNADAQNTAQAANHKSDLASLVYLAAQTLGDRAESLDKARPIIVSTVVSVDHLEHASTFGRLVSQLVANRLQQRGYLVRDVTYMRALELRPGTGELVLTREASKVGATANAQAVVAGTYAVAGQEIYLNLRLIDAASGVVVASTDAVIPLNENTSALFGSDTPMEKMITFDRFVELARKAELEHVP
jgi:hypothetical protein